MKSSRLIVTCFFVEMTLVLRSRIEVGRSIAISCAPRFVESLDLHVGHIDVIRVHPRGDADDEDHLDVSLAVEIGNF